MKKFGIALFALIVLTMFSQVLADVVTTRRINNQETVPQVQTRSNVSQNTDSNIPVTTRRLVNNVKSCSPYSESSRFDVGGMNFDFNIKIAGWVNNKCRMDFIANSAGISSSFQSIFGMDASDADVYSFAPKFKCEFTKQQLAEVGDSILEEESRKNGGKMLKNPNNIDILSMSQMSGNDMKLMQMLTDGKTCQLMNAGDVDKILNSIFGY